MADQRMTVDELKGVPVRRHESALRMLTALAVFLRDQLEPVEGRRLVWNVLAGLRGPDGLYEGAIKHAKKRGTVPIRRRFLELADLASDYPFDTFMASVGAAVAPNVPYDQAAVDASNRPEHNTHFRDHATDAWAALNELDGRGDGRDGRGGVVAPFNYGLTILPEDGA